MADYLITRDRTNPTRTLWRVTRTDAAGLGCRIGVFTSHREALQCARLLAGCRGSVTMDEGRRLSLAAAPEYHAARIAQMDRNMPPEMLGVMYD